MCFVRLHVTNVYGCVHKLEMQYNIEFISAQVTEYKSEEVNSVMYDQFWLLSTMCSLTWI